MTHGMMRRNAAGQVMTGYGSWLLEGEKRAGNREKSSEH
jgi:hypothetical protein